MALERIFHCDGPDCERHVRTIRTIAPAGHLTVSGDGKPLHFCGWDCVLRYAGNKEPEEVIPFDPGDDFPQLP